MRPRYLGWECNNNGRREVSRGGAEIWSGLDAKVQTEYKSRSVTTGAQELTFVKRCRYASERRAKGEESRVRYCSAQANASRERQLVI